MSTESKFFDQFEGNEELEECRDSFYRFYAHALVNGSEEDALAIAIVDLSEFSELDHAPSEEDLEIWLNDVEEIEDACRRERLTDRRLKAIEAFEAKRASGSTFLQAAKASGEDIDFVIRALSIEKEFIDIEGLTVRRKVRREEYLNRAYNSRQKTYKLIRSKVEEAIKLADFSTLSPDKLVMIMLKLTELSKADNPPNKALRIDPFYEV